MKKTIFSLLVVGLILLLSGTAYATELGELEKVEDQLSPDGKDAIILQKVTAVTNDKGEVAFPFYEDGEVLKVEAVQGSIAQEVQQVEYGDKKYNLIVFNEKAAEVVFTVTMKLADAYEGEEADLGDTFPSGALEIKFKAVNTSPNDIGSYSARIAVPQGKELLNIVDYDAEEAFSISEQDGYVFGGFDFDSIAAGEEAELAINIFSPRKAHIIVVWIGAVIISVAFMLKNRKLLRKA